MESVSESDDEGVVEEREDVFFCLDVSVEICAEYPFLPDGFEGKEGGLSALLDEIDFPKSTLSNFLIEFERGESDGFYFLSFPDKLIELEDMFLPPELGILLLLPL